jgi:hypothetical protein
LVRKFILAASVAAEVGEMCRYENVRCEPLTTAKRRDVRIVMIEALPGAVAEQGSREKNKRRHYLWQLLTLWRTLAPF